MQVLIAEDDAHLARGLSHLLTHEGYRVTVVSDGAAVLAQFRQQPPDFCILDVMLPNVDGFALCQQIRREKPQIPIIMLSACNEEIDRLTGLELGADDYVTKPFSAKELLARMKNILRRCAPLTPTQQQAFQIADLQVDPASLRAHRGQEEIALSAREVAMLALFAQHPRRVLSRDQLLDQLWGQEYLPNSRALDQSICTLRRKIERNASQPQIIQTVHGAGYRYDGF